MLIELAAFSWAGFWVVVAGLGALSIPPLGWYGTIFFMIFCILPALTVALAHRKIRKVHDKGKDALYRKRLSAESG